MVVDPDGPALRSLRRSVVRKIRDGIVMIRDGGRRSPAHRGREMSWNRRSRPGIDGEPEGARPLRRDEAGGAGSGSPMSGGLPPFAGSPCTLDRGSRSSWPPLVLAPALHERRACGYQRGARPVPGRMNTCRAMYSKVLGHSSWGASRAGRTGVWGIFFRSVTLDFPILRQRDLRPGGEVHRLSSGRMSAYLLCGGPAILPFTARVPPSSGSPGQPVRGGPWGVEAEEEVER